MIYFGQHYYINYFPKNVDRRVRRSRQELPTITQQAQGSNDARRYDFKKLPSNRQMEKKAKAHLQLSGVSDPRCQVTGPLTSLSVR